MAFELILSQGRIADRTPGAIAGARLTAAALGEAHGIAIAHEIGVPAAHAWDDWSNALAQAGTTLAGLAASVEDVLARGATPVSVVNTCSASLATLPAAARHRSDLHVLWIDAHGDFNNPSTTDSGYLGGMVLAAACGQWDSGHGAGVDPAKVVVAGLRDVDDAEAELLARAGVALLPPAMSTPGHVMAKIGSAPVWVHIDWDALEPGYVPAAYRVAQGLLPAQVRALLAALAPGQLVGLELAEFEAGADPLANEAALGCILSTVAPVFAR